MVKCGERGVVQIEIRRGESSVVRTEEATEGMRHESHPPYLDGSQQPIFSPSEACRGASERLSLPSGTRCQAPLTPC